MQIRNLARKLVRPPVEARHVELSALISIDDDPAQHSDRLLDLALAAVGEARKIDLSWITQRSAVGGRWANTWPGDHYRLLAGLVRVLRPQRVVELGTALGVSALAMKAELPAQGRVTTFDVVPWRAFEHTVLRDEDFDGSLVQLTDDLSGLDVARKHERLLREADVLFLDAMKDGVMEHRFWANFHAVGLKPGAIVVFDDIRLWNMLSFWRNVREPKLDLTSLGHFTGTGLVEWPAANA